MSERFIRDVDAGDVLEIFLISSIASILAIRAFLQLTGYPQLGGEELHIAHMLWGGLFMLAALILLLSYWDLSVRRLGALLAASASAPSSTSWENSSPTTTTTSSSRRSR
jgi:hypothetical protein